MGNANAKGGSSPTGSAKARRSSLSDRFRSSRSSSKDLGDKLTKTPTNEEVSLASRLQADHQSPAGPPFYAVSGAWLLAWSSFVLAGASAPGPIGNASLMKPGKASGSTAQDDETVWLSASDWHLLHGVHGGGPVLCRASQTLALTPEKATGGSFASSEAKLGSGTIGESKDLERLVGLMNQAMHLHASRCHSLGQSLASQVELLQKGAWAKKRSVLRKKTDNASAARERIGQAVATHCGGEELRAALQELREAGDTEPAGILEPLVAEVCVHEEAQIVLACLLQAIQDSDRISLELWLEQAEAAGLERLIDNSPHLLGLLSQHLVDLEDREKGALHRHSHSAELRNEDPSGRMWRISIAAFEDNDEATLVDLVQESKSIGLDTSAVEMLVEELYEKRAAAERASRPSWAYRPNPSKEPKDGAKGPSSWNDPGSWATPGSGDWKDPASWNNTEDFLNAYRKWKHQDRANKFGEAEAARMSFQEEMERERARFEQEERQKRAHMERERQRMFQEEQERQQKRRQGNFNFNYDYTGGGYGRYGGASYSSSSSRAAPPASSSTIGTSEALRVLGFPPGRVPPLQDLKTAYKKAAMRAHPDRPHNRDRKEAATAEFQKVKASFDALAETAPSY